MSFGVSGTGAYQQASSPMGVAVRTFGYCTNYVSGVGSSYTSDKQFDFGINLSEIVIVNPGSEPIAFQWKENWGKAQDNGVVLGNSSCVFRKALKSGIAVRGLVAGNAECIVFGI